MHSNNSKVLVTGGSGFIGSNFIYDYLDSHDGSIVNLDLITYAGSGNNLDLLPKESRYNFVKGSGAQSVQQFIERSGPIQEYARKEFGDKAKFSNKELEIIFNMYHPLTLVKNPAFKAN